MLFKYKDTSPPVDPTKVVEQATHNAGRPGTPWEQILAQMHIDQEYDLIQKRNMFCLTYW